MVMAFEIEVDREHIENTLSVTYTMGQINSYMEIIRELKEIPKTMWLTSKRQSEDCKTEYKCCLH